MGNNEKLQDLIIYKKPATIAAIVFLVLAIFPWPYGYYVFLRWAVFLVSGFLVYLAFSLKRTVWVALFALIAILFNPIVRVPLDREIWQTLDLVVAIVFTLSIFILKQQGKGNNPDQNL